MDYRLGASGTIEVFGNRAPAPFAQPDSMLALERIGARRAFRRDEEIYGEGEAADCWYGVVTGTVRICKFLSDGRRHIAEFCFSGDSFGLSPGRARVFSAEAVGDVSVMRYPQRLASRLIEQDPRLARSLYDMTLHDLTRAQSRMLVLGRMTAPERVASFLLEMAERQNATLALDLPMSRLDIADYLGLTIETVCRVLSAFKHDGVIAMPASHRVEFQAREALEAIADA